MHLQPLACSKAPHPSHLPFFCSRGDYEPQAEGYRGTNVHAATDWRRLNTSLDRCEVVPPARRTPSVFPARAQRRRKATKLPWVAAHHRRDTYTRLERHGAQTNDGKGYKQTLLTTLPSPPRNLLLLMTGIGPLPLGQQVRLVGKGRDDENSRGRQGAQEARRLGPAADDSERAASATGQPPPGGETDCIIFPCCA